MDPQELIAIIESDIKMVVLLKESLIYLHDPETKDNLPETFFETAIELVQEVSLNHSNLQAQEMAFTQALKQESGNVELEQIEKTFSEWLVIVNEDLFEAIIDLLENNFKFDHFSLKIIIDYILIIEYNNIKTFQKLFGLLISNGQFIPMETFGVGMYILERYGFINLNPDIHPGYAYSEIADIQHEVIECPHCKVEGEPFLTEYSYLTKTFDNPHTPLKLWMRCNNCNNSYSRYLASQFSNISNETVLLKPQEINEKSNDVNSNDISYYNEVFDKIKTLNSNNSLLNIGVDTNTMTSVALDKGYSVENVEIDDQSLLVNYDFLSISTEKKYNVVIINDFFEKNLYTIESILKIRNLLLDDAILWISTTNSQSVYENLQDDDYLIWKEPLHCNCFSRSGFIKILNICGLEVIEYKDKGHKKGYMEFFVKKR